MESEFKQLLMKAKDEIKGLRNTNERLSIRLEAIDDMLLLLNAKQPERNQGMSVDVVWEIEKALARVPDEQGS